METNKNRVWDHLFDLSHPGGTPKLATACSCICLSFPFSFPNICESDFTGPVSLRPSSFVPLRPCFRLLLRITDHNKQRETWTRVSSPTKHSEDAAVSFLSHHTDLWKPRGAIFYIVLHVSLRRGYIHSVSFVTFVTLSLALTDKAQGHCHLLMLNSCLHPLYPPPHPPVSSFTHCFPFWSIFPNVLCYPDPERHPHRELMTNNNNMSDKNVHTVSILHVEIKLCLKVRIY